MNFCGVLYLCLMFVCSVWRFLPCVAEQIVRNPAVKLAYPLYHRNRLKDENSVSSSFFLSLSSRRRNNNAFLNPLTITNNLTSNRVYLPNKMHERKATNRNGLAPSRRAFRVDEQQPLESNIDLVSIVSQDGGANMRKLLVREHHPNLLHKITTTITSESPSLASASFTRNSGRHPFQVLRGASKNEFTSKMKRELSGDDSRDILEKVSGMEGLPPESEDATIPSFKNISLQINSSFRGGNETSAYRTKAHILAKDSKTIPYKRNENASTSVAGDSVEKIKEMLFTIDSLIRLFNSSSIGLEIEKMKNESFDVESQKSANKTQKYQQIHSSNYFNKLNYISRQNQNKSVKENYIPNLVNLLLTNEKNGTGNTNQASKSYLFPLKIPSIQEKSSVASKPFQGSSKPFSSHEPQTNLRRKRGPAKKRKRPSQKKEAITTTSTDLKKYALAGVLLGLPLTTAILSSLGTPLILVAPLGLAIPAIFSLGYMDANNIFGRSGSRLRRSKTSKGNGHRGTPRQSYLQTAGQADVSTRSFLINNFNSLRPVSHRMMAKNQGTTTKVKRETHLQSDPRETFRELRPNTEEEESYLKRLREMKDHYNRLLSGHLEDMPKLEDIEKDKAYLINLFEIITEKRNIKEEVKLELNNALTNVLESLNLSSLRKDTNDSLLEANMTKNHDQYPSLKAKKVLKNEESSFVLSQNQDELKNFPKLISKDNNNLFSRAGNFEIPSVFSVLDAIDHSKQDTNLTDILKTNPAIKKETPNFQNGKGSLDRDNAFSKRMGEINTSHKEVSSTSLQLQQLKSNSILSLLPEKPLESIQNSAASQNSFAPNYNPSGSSFALPSKTHDQVAFNSPLDVVDATGQNAANLLLELFLKDTGALTALEEYLLASSSNVTSHHQPTGSNILLTGNANLFNHDPLRAELLSILPTQTENVGQTANLPLQSEALANLMFSLQVPSAAELTNAVPVTKLSPELVDAVSTFIQSIADAITTFITDLQTIFTENPLLAALLSLALFGLIWHLLKKKKKGYGHSHHGHKGGYHRSDQPLFRSFDDYGQMLTLDVLSHLEAFEKWLKKNKTLDDHSSQLAF